MFCQPFFVEGLSNDMQGGSAAPDASLVLFLLLLNITKDKCWNHHFSEITEGLSVYINIFFQFKF